MVEHWCEKIPHSRALRQALKILQKMLFYALFSDIVEPFENSKGLGLGNFHFFKNEKLMEKYMLKKKN